MVISDYFKFLILFLLSSLVLGSPDDFFMVPILDENGNRTGLFNVNPDPHGEPWISGGGRALTAEEENCIPEFILPAHYRDRTKYPLPEKVDNSRTKYFPPIFTQKGASCCQASGVSYALNYEICRIRDLDASKQENIFPYGFAYNFLNKGSTSTYSMYTDGWYMSEELGAPNLIDYGGSLQGTASQTSWLDGYDKYYRAMNNRYIKSYRFNSTTNEGIEGMKQWLFDHADGAKFGGVICFLAWSGQTRDKLPSSSPEAGHTYIKKFNTSGGHCMTIVGYHDDIFYDLDKDGKISDQEKGGFLMVNSYGTSYGTEGRAYIPYSLLLAGTLKSKNVHGITVKKEFKPLLTFRVTITHNKRNQIKIIRGFSTDLNASSPSKTYRYKECFANGGPLPMAGKNLSKTIEIGLDVTEFIKEINGKKAKFFLQINSQDGEGKVNSLSVLDYTGSQVKEYTCSQTDVPITNGITTLDVQGDITNSQKVYNGYGTPTTHFYPSPLQTGNNISFQLPAIQHNTRVFRVLTIHGKLMYEKALNAENNFTWDITSNSGEKIASGKYIAQLELMTNKGINKKFHTQVYVME